MKYFCSYSYFQGETALFGNGTFETTVDPYDDIVEFRDQFNKAIGLPQVVLLFYKKVKS